MIWSTGFSAALDLFLVHFPSPCGEAFDFKPFHTMPKKAPLTDFNYKHRNEGLLVATAQKCSLAVHKGGVRQWVFGWREGTAWLSVWRDAKFGKLERLRNQDSKPWHWQMIRFRTRTKDQINGLLASMLAWYFSAIINRVPGTCGCPQRRSSLGKSTGCSQPP